MKIEVLISTLNDGIYNLNGFDNRLCYLIVHQVSNGSINYQDFTSKFPCNVRYIKLDGKGLSVSRNIALNNAQGDYLWIMDDDVKIYGASYEKLKDYIARYPSVDMFVLNHSSDESIKSLNFDEKKLHRFNSFSVSSIDMFLKRSSIEGLRFDERFGLGTALPSGEEYIFTCSLLKNKKKIFKTNTVFSYHPPITSGIDFYSTPEKMRAKLYMFRETSGYLFGSFLYLLFVIKKMKLIYRGRGVLNIFRAFYRK
ncbi:glycosyltransferase family 2 protein [Vibrio rotiferianus]|uniref:glycosyltransferase family 2 protein n=1 Tax=Vibrio rotiferianus TaxID=190895 RepID=UPI002894A152|nr:Glycosyltransferase [Vibrio rotiferianus]